MSDDVVMWAWLAQHDPILAEAIRDCDRWSRLEPEHASRYARERERMMQRAREAMTDPERAGGME